MGGTRGGGPWRHTRHCISHLSPPSHFRAQVFDWDAGSRNDLLGFADVPLRGVLQNGYISAALGLPSTEKGSGKKGEKKKTMAAGSGGKDSAVAGKIELLGTPRYAQFGDVVHRIPGMTYLALHVISAKGLLSRSEDGHDANPFVTATWDQVSQQTRVVRRSTAPQFGETIYFPLRLLTLHGEEGKKALEKKGGAAATAPTHPSHTRPTPLISHAPPLLHRPQASSRSTCSTTPLPAPTRSASSASVSIR